MKKAEQTSLTIGDMNIKKPATGIMMDIILDGHILYSHLKQLHEDEDWIMAELKARNIDNIKDVVSAGLQADNQIYIITKND